MGPEAQSSAKQPRGRPFVKGQSGNPGGRPKIAAAVREMAAKHNAEAIKALVDALKDPRLCVAAASALLDRAVGKPPQAITGPDGEALTLAIQINLGGVK